MSAEYINELLPDYLRMDKCPWGYTHDCAQCYEPPCQVKGVEPARPVQLELKF